MIGALRVQLGIDSAQFTSGLNRAQRQAGSASKGIERSLAGIGRAVAGVAAGFSAMAAAQAFLAIADKAKGMDAQLRLATASFGSFNQAQEDARRIAQESRGGLVETATLYTAFLRTSQEIGRSQMDAAQATETFSKALKIGGADTSAVASATLQMKQALSSATVQWEELGPILEASPRIAKVLTDAFGVTRSELKKMAEDGKLSGKMMFDALNKPEIIRQINAEFATLGTTFAEAMQQVENAAIITFGAFERGGGFSKALADFVTSGGDGFAGLEKSAEEFGITARAEFEGLVGVGTQVAADIRAGWAALHDMFEPIRAAAESVFGSVRTEALSSREYVASLFDTIDTIRNAPANAAIGLRNMLKKNNGIDLPRNWFVPDDFQMSNLGGAYRRRAAGADGRLRAEQARRNAANRRNNGTGTGSTTNPTASGSGKKAGGKGKSPEQIAREAERKREQALRAQYQLDREEVDGKRQLLAAQRELTADYTERNILSVQMLDLDRQAREKQIDLDLAMGDITKVEADRRRALEDQLTLLGKRRIWQEEELDRLAGIAAVEDEAFSLRERALQGESALAETMAERREVEMRILDLAREREQKEIDRLRMGSVEDQQRADMRQSALNGNYARDRATVNAQTRGPWESFLTSLPTSAAKANEAIEAIAAGGVSDLVDGLSDAMVGARSLGDVFKQVAKSIIADLIRIQIQKALVGAIGNELGGLLGGIGGGVKVAPGSEFGLGSDLKGFSPNLTGLATGGSISVLGKGGLDTNLLSINGMPVARVNRGERIRVDPNARPANDRGIFVRVEESPIFRATVREEANTQSTAVSIDSQRKQLKRARGTMGRGGRGVR